MIPFVRENPSFSLCGLNCCLCPRFNTEGDSRCPGCGGQDFSSKHPTCAVVTCNRKHDDVEYCFRCSEYPCAKYRVESACDSFISYKGVIRNLTAAKDDLGKYLGDLETRRAALETLLGNYNDGRSKGLYCLVANDMPLPELESLLGRLGDLPAGTDVKEMSKRARAEIAALEEKLGLVFKLRTKRA